jgi:hypothetical protein
MSNDGFEGYDRWRSKRGEYVMSESRKDEALDA